MINTPFAKKCVLTCINHLIHPLQKKRIKRLIHSIVYYMLHTHELSISFFRQSFLDYFLGNIFQQCMIFYLFFVENPLLYDKAKIH